MAVRRKAKTLDPRLNALRSDMEALQTDLKGLGTDVGDIANDRAHQAVRDTLASERYGDLAFGLACWAAGGGWRQGVDVELLLTQRQPVRSFADAILSQRHPLN